MDFLLGRISVRYFRGGGYYNPPPPDVATEEDPEVKAAAEEAAKKEADLARKRKGRRSTILTGGQGVQGEASISYASLLGGTKERLGQ